MLAGEVTFLLRDEKQLVNDKWHPLLQNNTRVDNPLNSTREKGQ